MKTARPLVLLLAVFALVGCGPKDTPPSQSAPPPVIPPTGGNPPVVSPPTGQPPVTPPAAGMTLEQALKEVPDTALVPLDFEYQKVKFTIQVPKGTKAAKDGEKLDLPDGIALEIKVEHADVPVRKEWWNGHGVYQGKQFLIDSPNTFLVESTEKKDERFSFLTVVTSGPLDVSIRSMKGFSSLVTKADSLLLLKCARTIALKTPPPADPVEALEAFGNSVTKEEGKVTKVFLEGACTRSTLGLLAKLPDLKSIHCGFTGVRGVDLAALKTLPKLESFSTNLFHFGEAGCAALAECKQLKRVSLHYSALKPEYVAQLKGLTGLTHLSISLNGLATMGPESLEGMADLESLSLDDTGVGDGVLKAVKKMTKLKHLSLTGSDISDAGLADLEGLKELKTVELSSKKLTDDGVKKLQAALPNAKITFDKK